MKNADMNKVFEKAMRDFADAYNRLQITIERYEQTTETSVNNLRGFVDKYPFETSFDELQIADWVDCVVEGLNQLNFQVVDYEYLNTGGNTMVGIHEVWLPEEKKTVYVYTNEESCVMSAADYIRNELDADDYEDFTIDFGDFGTMTGHEKYFELYRRCLNDYTKDDCRYFGTTRCISYHLLSDELQKTVDADYLAWVENEYDGLVETNGLTTFENPLYEPAVELEEIQQIKDFQAWHTAIAADVDTRESLYDSNYVLTIADKTVLIPFNADTFSAIEQLLKTAAEEC